MAETSQQIKDRASPTEDFDPLKDDLPAPTSQQQPDEDADHSSDEVDADNADQQYNSLDAMEAYFTAQANDLPFSPPINSRLLKQSKKYNKQSYKEYKSNIAMEKQKKPRTCVNVIKERYSESAMLSGLTAVDSDADFERELSRETKEKRKKERDEKQKNMTKSRQNDIKAKRHSEDLSAGFGSSNTDPMEIQTPVIPLKLEGSGRFLSLNASKPVPLSPVPADRVERRQPCSSISECPKDRLNFYRTFYALINMGSHGKKQKEQKEKDKFFAQRQKSSDEKMYMRHIWLGLQAWLNGLSPSDQETKYGRERETIPNILAEISNFKVQFPLSVPETAVGDQAIPVEDGSGDLLKTGESSISVETSASAADISETYHSMFLSTEMIAQQQEAVIQVQRLLQKLDHCEQLYPTSYAFAQDYPSYKDSTFVRRLESLYLWLNITKDLCYKLKVLGQVLNVHSVPGAAWPYVDFDSPSHTDFSKDEIIYRRIPEITRSESGDEDDTSDVADTESAEEDSGSGQMDPLGGVSKSLLDNNNKKVSFNFQSASSTPKRDRSPNNIGSPTSASTPLKAPFSNASLSRASSEASIDEIARTSIYRLYVDKGLKKMGLNKMLIRLRDILYRSLQRARQSLELPHIEFQHSESGCKSPSEDFHHHPVSSPSLDLLDKMTSVPVQSHTPEELMAWREEFLVIGLPSYRPTYIFLLGVLLEVIHEAMKIRLEQLENPIGEPSFLSIRQLIIECKDVLAKAVLVKQDYQCMVEAVLDDEEANSENSPLDLEKFDDDMSKMFKMYFQYLQNWLYHLQNLPEASRSLKNPLEDEWSFTKKICPHIIGGEAEAGKRFSTMAISLLNSIADFLENGIDEYTASLLDWTTDDMSASDEAESDEDRDHDPSLRRASKSFIKVRKSFQKTCRNFKNLFHEARERASKALGFAKLLRKDLEIAADFNVAVPTQKLLEKLKNSNHMNVVAPLSAGYLMFIPERISEQKRQIIQLLNVTCGREDISVSSDFSVKDEGYLLMVRCDSGLDGRMECPLWTGHSIQVEPTAETAIALSHIQVDSLLLVVIHSSHLASQRKEFELTMGNTVELVNEQTSCHQVIAESLIELKESAMTLRDKVSTSIGHLEEHWDCDVINEQNEKTHLIKLYRETMLQGYNFGFEYMKEMTRLVSGETRHKLGVGLMHFAKDWMKFVSEKCERGRGMRPRWANPGLDFLLVACEPKILAVLSEQEYQELQESINDFISHLIGNAEKSQTFNTPAGSVVLRAGGSDSAFKHYNRYPSWPAASHDKMTRSASSRSMTEAPPVPHTAPAAYQMRTIHSVPSLDSSDAGDQPGSKKRSSEGNVEVDLHDGDDGGIVMEVHRRQKADLTSSPFSYHPRDRRVSAIKKLERERNHRLQQQRVIGRTTSRNTSINYHINTRKVNFHWQKGNKIGEGQFGKVYSAVNMDTGDLMAMKEMKFPPADLHYHFKEIIDEIKIFEGIHHPNLVKYHGVEVHRTEMLVFMEYCDRGTIDEVSRVGLTENLVRLYTRELLIAIQQLHDHGIVHRDIKGANIFLTSNGCLKLGDFGCSVKLKNHTTMAGEVNSLVGTTAYMAPEVITRNQSEGHGRAADIWSLGCVVIEMVSGKRPWHELENTHQIMFKVGMGGTPTIPENLGDEGKDFLSHCLMQDPEDRWTASQLRDHPFAKIHDPEGDEDGMDSTQT